MPTVVLTNVTCTGFAEPLTIDFFFDNNNFQPVFSVAIDSANPIPLDMRADYYQEGFIVIHRDNIPILKSGHFFTLFDSGKDSTDFSPFQVQDASYGFYLDYCVENDLATLIFAYVRTIAVATLTFIVSFIQILTAPLRNLLFGRRKQ